MKKITRATIKSFIAKQVKEDNLYINNLSSFDGMVDCVMPTKSDFRKAAATTRHENSLQYNLGIEGIWLVGSSRDSFTAYQDDNFEGFEVYNCCGSFIIAAKK